MELHLLEQISIACTVGADLRVCPGLDLHVTTGADTQVCPYVNLQTALIMEDSLAAGAENVEGLQIE